MNKIVSFLTLGLMTFAVTLATYTLTKEALNGANTETRTVLFINKNQVFLQPVTLVSRQPGSHTKNIAFSTPGLPRGCNAPSIGKAFAHIIPAIETSRRL